MEFTDSTCEKSNGENRFVCDYRNLNSITKKDTYPLPHMKDVIDTMHNSTYWSSLDASASWAIPLREQDKEKSAFSVKRGKVEFNVMSYGLCNAGATYLRLNGYVPFGFTAQQNFNINGCGYFLRLF